MLYGKSSKNEMSTDVRKLEEDSKMATNVSGDTAFRIKT